LGDTFVNLNPFANRNDNPMSFPQPRSSGTRVQEVSRQFTAPERAVDERITSHILNPMPTVSGIDAATGYKWLEEDLKFRANLTAQLNQERDLTNAQSMRQELISPNSGGPRPRFQFLMHLQKFL
jgi:hypothetical protein